MSPLTLNREPYWIPLQMHHSESKRVPLTNEEATLTEKRPPFHYIDGQRPTTTAVGKHGNEGLLMLSTVAYCNWVTLARPCPFAHRLKTVPPPPGGGDGHHCRPNTYQRILCRIHGWSVACCRLPKALGYTLTCIDADGVMHMVQISKIHNALRSFISYQPAPTAKQGQRESFHNFSGAKLVHDASVLFTMGRRALQNSQHRLLCKTDIAP